MPPNVTRLTPPRAKRPPDDFERLDDEFDFPSWISEPRPDPSDFHEESVRGVRRTWVLMIVGVVAAAVASAAVLRPLLNSALDRRPGTERPLSAQLLAAAPLPVQRSLPVQQAPKRQPNAQDVAAARQRLVDDMARLKVDQAQAQEPVQTQAQAQAPAQMQAQMQVQAPPPGMTTAALEPPRVDEPAVAPPPPPAPGISFDEASRMMVRAASLVRQGQIGSARALLELATRSRDPQAYLALADTYNPRMLARWHAIGITGDEARALALYRQAAEGGITEANARLRELGE